MNGALRFAGYAAIFDRRDAGGDVIRMGAFARTLAAGTAPLPLYWQHRPDARIGWVEHAAEDRRGLRVIARIDAAQPFAAQLLRAGTARGLSFGYHARAFRRDGHGRELTDVSLFEISLVTRPMQSVAQVHLIG